MSQKKTMNLDEFKELMTNEKEEKDRILGRCDVIDLDNGVMRIYPEHINKYLEQYACKDAQDLEDTLWYSYGVWVHVI